MVATIYLNQQQRLINALCRPFIESVGYAYIGCDYLKQGLGSLIRVYIDKPQGITLDDCAIVSQQLGILLDTEGTIDSHYSLEVSSPGVERVLFSLIDFQNVINQHVLLYLTSMLKGRYKIFAKLIGVNKDTILLVFNDEKIVISLDIIKKARLVPSDVR